MIGDIVGWVFTKADFEFTRDIPYSMFESEEETDKRNKAMKSNLLPVWEIAVDGSSYLCLIRMPEGKDFIWDIDKRDTSHFMQGDVIGDMQRSVRLRKVFESLDVEPDLDLLEEISKKIKEKTGIDPLKFL